MAVGKSGCDKASGVQRNEDHEQQERLPQKLDSAKRRKRLDNT